MEEIAVVVGEKMGWLVLRTTGWRWEGSSCGKMTEWSSGLGEGLEQEHGVGVVGLKCLKNCL